METVIEAQEANRANRITWALLTCLLLVALGWLPFSTVSLAPMSLLLPISVGAGLTAGAWYYRCRRGEGRLSDALDCTGQMTAFTALGPMLSYLIATVGFPLQDRAFYAADLSLGLDWLAYLKAVDARPWLGALFSFAYASFIPQAIVLIAVLSFSGEGTRIRVIILAMMIAGVITILISGFLPAMAMFVHLGLGPADYPNLKPAASFVHVVDMAGLRSGAPFRLDLMRAEGIITFPSYHAAVGMLLLIGSAANRWARWPLGLLSLTMIAATPIDGGHYFVDVAAGLGIAVGSYFLARRFIVVTGPACQSSARLANAGLQATL
ncbi:phosphatase PAP2 family protein [Bosea sp. RAF48]|uniref:phosphatase PAP2 family protein n=1 Tax=Bosea sp. RAF48 TaxID=3237480 RepID=UPI003F9125E2